ncbi:hypothetical protein BH18GEM1_BH18GEM1_11220 [soil metagenome]
MNRSAATPLTVERRPGRLGEPVVLEVSGELVVTTWDTLAEAVRELMEAGERRIILDLGSLSHIDTPGLALLYRLHERLTTADGTLAIVGLPERFADLIRHLRLHDLLRFRTSVEAALREFAG